MHFYLLSLGNLIAQFSRFYFIFHPSSLSLSSILVQVAEEIGTEARFQKDFLNQLVNHYDQIPCFTHAHTHTHTHMGVYFL